MADDPDSNVPHPQPRPDPTSVAVPDTFLVGAPKCATTALATWLDAHPRCSVTTPKEPHFWSFDLPGLRHVVGCDDPARYSSIVERARQSSEQVIDASTTYLMSEVAVAEIIKANPAAKFVAAVRDPFELVPSYFQTQRNAVNETESSLTRALELTADRRRGIGVPEQCSDPAMLDYERVAMNGSHVRRLIRAAGADHVLVIVHGDLEARPQFVWSELCRFMGVEMTEQSFDVIHPGGRQPRFSTMHRLVHRPPEVLRRPMTWMRQRTERPANDLVRRAKQALWSSADRPVVDDRAAEIIRTWFADDVELLASTIDRDLSGWLGQGAT